MSDELGKFTNAENQSIRAILERYLDLIKCEGYVETHEKCQCRRENIMNRCLLQQEDGQDSDWRTCVPWRVKKEGEK